MIQNMGWSLEQLKRQFERHITAEETAANKSIITQNKPAAVLIPLKNIADKTYMVLTKRTEHLYHHPGQICFPGGRQDDNDSGPAQTAIRETCEEIGIEKHNIDLWTALDPVHTITGFTVMPFVGSIASTAPYLPCEDEVAEVLEVPLDFFLDTSNQQKKMVQHESQQYEVTCYRYKHHDIWGATARIIESLIGQLR